MQQVIVGTGASSGFGALTARALADAGRGRTRPVRWRRRSSAASAA